MPNAFEIITPKKSFVVFADSALDKQAWIEEFNNVIEQQLIKNAKSPIIRKQRVDTENLAPVWIHDKDALECMICNKSFTLLNRRHHCRKCGKVVCGRCSEHKTTLKNIGLARVCDECYSVRKTVILSSSPVARRPSMAFTIETISQSTLARIFSYLDLTDLKNIASVSKSVIFSKISDLKNVVVKKKKTN